MTCLDLIGKHSSSDVVRHLALASESYSAFFQMMREFYFQIRDDLSSTNDAAYRSMFKIEDVHIQRWDEIKSKQAEEVKNTETVSDAGVIKKEVITEKTE